MGTNDKQARISQYQSTYLGDYGFEAVMVASRQKMALEFLSKNRPETVIEVGCGADLLYHKAVAAALPIRRWVTVEPAERFLDVARAAVGGAIELRVVPGFVEDSIEAIGHRADAVLLCSMLHEVPDPLKIVEAARELLSPTGIVHANVPNAYSFHRRLARAMGMIAHEKTMGERNQSLAQYRVFGLSDLVSLIEEAGLVAQETGGYLVKPFTHKQMESVADVVTPEVLDGLWQLGRELPEWASEVYVNARRST